MLFAKSIAALKIRSRNKNKISPPHLTNIWNTQIINHHIFLDNLKLVDVTPEFKKEDSN